MEKNLKKKENEGINPNRIKICVRKTIVRVFSGNRLSNRNEKFEIEMVDNEERHRIIIPIEPIVYKEKLEKIKIRDDRMH